MAKNPFKQWWKNYLGFSKKDRNAIVTLGGLIIVVVIGHVVVEFIDVSTPLDREKARQAINEWSIANKQSTKKYSLFEFNPNTVSPEELDSLFVPEFVKQNIISYRNAGGSFEKPADLRKIYGMNDSIFAVIESFVKIPQQVNSEEVKSLKATNEIAKLNGYFDPNVADKNSLLKFGFNAYQANNLINYRKSGGFFYVPDDVLKIYGVDSAFFNTLKKHIRIDFEKKELKEVIQQPQISIELNAATAEQLEKLRGIGPVFAARIVKFRNLLGGFYSKKQLLEVYNLPEETYFEIQGNISVDTTAIKQIRLNFADFGELIRHPYLQEDDVKKILKYREKYGPFDTTKHLYDTGIISKNNFDRIKPYLSCR